jgi:hypothetical protein
VATEAYAKATLRQRAVHELTEFAILTTYLYITLGAVILMKASVLHDHGIHFAPWGIAAVKAAVLAKFMLLGRAMKFGERYSSRPLIWPTLYRSFAFLVLLVVLTIIEEVVVGQFYHQSVAASLNELAGAKLYETLADIVILFLVLIPYFAASVLNEALGEGSLVRMFFGGREFVPPRFDSDLLFAPGSWEMREQGKQIIAKMVEKLAPTQQSKLLVNGYTDNAPIGPGLQEQGVTTNQELSQKRADAVMEHLIARGVKADLVSAHGYGEANPIATNNSAQGREKNRRVELALANSGS